MVKGMRLGLLKLLTAARIAAAATVRPDAEMRLFIGRCWVTQAKEALPKYVGGSGGLVRPRTLTAKPTQDVFSLLVASL